MTGIPIYQFCRAFENVRWSDVYQRYVSGGYAFEKITRWNREVPEEIRQEVINGYFALNDNYPPEEDDFALIAREINDKYAVLAVANRQLDDGGRPTIGYKYFWLEKSSPDVDGILTLISWWSDQQEPKPKFKMEELVESSSPQIFYYRQEYPKTHFKEPSLQETLKTVEKLQLIPHTVVATKQEWHERPEYIKLHYLALGLSFRAKYSNAWAWNVNKIASPEKFLAIFYTTQEYIPSNIRKFSLSPLNSPSPQTHNPHNSDPNSNNSAITATTENTSPLAKNPGQIAPEKKIRKCLTDIATIFTNQNRLDDKKAKELFGYLEDYPDEDWSNFIDKITLNAPSGNENYKELIYLIVPEYPSFKSWLFDIVKSVNPENISTSFLDEFRDRIIKILLLDDNNQETILKFQKCLLENSSHYPKAKKRLPESIYFGITELLMQILESNQSNNRLNEYVEYFLIEYNNIYKNFFQEYAKILKRNIKNIKSYSSSETKFELSGDIENYPSIKLFFDEISKNQIDVKRRLPKKIRIEIFGKENPPPPPPKPYPNIEISIIVFVAGTAIFLVSWYQQFKILPILTSVTIYVILTIIACLLIGNPLVKRVSPQWLKLTALMYIFFTVLLSLIGFASVNHINLLFTKKLFPDYINPISGNSHNPKDNNCSSLEKSKFKMCKYNELTKQMDDPYRNSSPPSKK
ncbi:MAG: hypothetical protein ACKPBB_23485 [Sphaerospermopsis kisseleviana]